MKTYLPYYCQYKDENNHTHYAIHLYRHSDGWVWTMNDYKMKDMAYDKHPTKKF